MIDIRNEFIKDLNNHFQTSNIQQVIEEIKATEPLTEKLFQQEDKRLILFLSTTILYLTRNSTFLIPTAIYLLWVGYMLGIDSVTRDKEIADLKRLFEREQENAKE